MHQKRLATGFRPDLLDELTAFPRMGGDRAAEKERVQGKEMREGRQGREERG